MKGKPSVEPGPCEQDTAIRMTGAGAATGRHCTNDTSKVILMLPEPKCGVCLLMRSGEVLFKVSRGFWVHRGLCEYVARHSKGPKWGPLYKVDGKNDKHLGVYNSTKNEIRLFLRPHTGENTVGGFWLFLDLCDTMSHEYVHFLLYKLEDAVACLQYDNLKL